MAKRTIKEASSILEIMKRAGRPMTPEALFVERGLDEDLVDLFFAELKELYELSHIKQETNATGVVLVLREEVLS